MNVPLVTFHYRDLKVFCGVYLQANRDFQKNHINRAVLTSCTSQQDLSN